MCFLLSLWLSIMFPGGGGGGGLFFSLSSRVYGGYVPCITSECVSNTIYTLSD